MKLAFVELSGFRGYRKTVRIDFGERFTVIDGRNGVGKSTIFDAIEFALTGRLSKYDDAKASGESADDYLWWTGEGAAPAERYVEVGFQNEESKISLRRTQFGEPDVEKLSRLSPLMCDEALAPSEPIRQLSTTAIIRDEQISSLSLDLKETDRYALLRDALGANDSEKWISRGASLLALAKRRTAGAQQEVVVAINEQAASGRRLDEMRASLVSDSVIREAASRLQKFAGTLAPADQLAGPARDRIAKARIDLQSLQSFSDQWKVIQSNQARLATTTKALDTAQRAYESASKLLRDKSVADSLPRSEARAAEARALFDLVSLGRKIGLRDGKCPLCTSGQTHDHFEQALSVGESQAKKLNEDAVGIARREQERVAAQAAVEAARKAVETVQVSHGEAVKALKDFEDKRRALGISPDATGDVLMARINEIRQPLDEAEKDLRIIETLKLSANLERAQRAEVDAKNKVVRAQERYGRARKAESIAQAFYDAARRAASETLDGRLERVLPLLSELYRRLRPHPVWSDIEYSIRGDVRRFMKLQVGDELNPQFLFSSGQRRATGLAFLLAVNLSLAWSKWKTILLDDPVQHVDDFRAVHLAELLAQLVSGGRQIVCAVEDPALADMLCRRIPVGRPGGGKRITLGADSEGAITKLTEQSLSPLVRSALVSGEQLASGQA